MPTRPVRHNRLTPAATVCLGMPLFNKTDLLEEALDSLQAQTYADYRLVILDDSTDRKPGRIAQAFAAEDSRICYIRNPKRKGMIRNWQACVQAAEGADYFAWVSDHDRWAPTWLETLVAILDANPQAVLVYPLTEHLGLDGQRRNKKLVHLFSTQGLSADERSKAVCRNARGYGKMVYGLFRMGSLKRAGVFRRLLFPDVILLLELSLIGEFHQVPEKLWYRRQTAEFSVARQRQMLFGEHKPWYAFAPWPIVNSCALFWNLCLRSDGGNWRRRWLGLLIALMYFQRWVGRYGEGTWIGSYHEWRFGKKPWMKRLKKRFQEIHKNSTTCV